NTVRSMSALISACEALTHANAHRGRFMAPSALGALTLAIIPYIFRSPSPFNSVAIIDAIMAFTSMTMMTFWPLSKPNALSYGKRVMLGGNCPVYVGSCNYLSSDWKQLAGCGWYNMSDPSFHFDGKTTLAEVEHYLGIVMFA